jgi:hypothetical protein
MPVLEVCCANPACSATFKRRGIKACCSDACRLIVHRDSPAVIAEGVLLTEAKHKRFIFTQNENLGEKRRDACNTTYSGPVNQNTRKCVRHLNTPKQYSAIRYGNKKEFYPPSGCRASHTEPLTLPDPVTTYGLGRASVNKFKLSSFVDDPKLRAKLEKRGD